MKFDLHILRDRLRILGIRANRLNTAVSLIALVRMSTNRRSNKCIIKRRHSRYKGRSIPRITVHASIHPNRSNGHHRGQRRRYSNKRCRAKPLTIRLQGPSLRCSRTSTSNSRGRRGRCNGCYNTGRSCSPYLDYLQCSLVEVLTISGSDLSSATDHLVDTVCNSFSVYSPGLVF